MLIEQSWNADTYKSSMQGIEQLAAPALKLLEQVQGKKLLDLGCGDGRLTQTLINRGYNVIAVDASADMVVAARSHGIQAVQMDARELSFTNQFDVVFSHAVLHWVKQPEQAIAGISRALKPNGLFIAQFGGKGDTHYIRSSLTKVMKRRGYDVAPLDPWYNPTPEEYNALLHQYRLVEAVPTCLIPWDYPLPGGMHGYVKAFFRDSLLSPLPAVDHMQAIDEAVGFMGQDLCDDKGNWHADFVRITVCARKTL